MRKKLKVIIPIIMAAIMLFVGGALFINTRANISSNMYFTDDMGNSATPSGVKGSQNTTNKPTSGINTNGQYGESTSERLDGNQGTSTSGSTNSNKSISTVKVGDYIEYTGGEYTGKWLVLKNTSGNVEIISKGIAGRLTLSGIAGYANGIKLLNDKCNTYVNSEYALSGRSVGATEDSVEEIDTELYPLTYEALQSNAGKEPYTDKNYVKDNAIISKNSELKLESGSIWVASRYSYTVAGPAAFSILLQKNGNFDPNDPLYYISPNGEKATECTINAGVRPVIALKPELQIVGGNGTETSPYRIKSLNEDEVELKVGDYIEYIPTKKSYSIGASETGDFSDQEFNPSETTSWIVFNTDNGVEIINEGSVGNLTLKGAAGYKNAVSVLDELSGQYINSSYAKDARSIGSTNNSISQITSELEYGSSNASYTDNNYEDDVNKIKENNLLDSNGSIWLASRNFETDANWDKYFVRSLMSVGEFDDSNLYSISQYGTEQETAYTRGVKVIVALRNDLKIISGDGSKDKPYILGIMSTPPPTRLFPTVAPSAFSTVTPPAPTSPVRPTPTIPGTVPRPPVTTPAPTIPSTMPHPGPAIVWDTTEQLNKEIKVRLNRSTLMDWGDNTGLVNLEEASGIVTLSHQYENEGTYCVTIYNPSAITYLDCSNSKVSDLNMANFTALEYLICHNNKLKSLNVNKNDKLKYLHCAVNEIEQLNVSNNTELTYFACLGNKLTSLDVSQNIKLKSLLCQSNKLERLDITKNTVLERLYCRQATMTELLMDKETTTEVDKHENTKIIYFGTATIPTYPDPSQITGPIYMIYDANTTDEVKFMPENGEKPYGAAVIIGMPIDPIREGYSFAGWNDKADGTGKAYKNAGTYTGNTSLTLYAQWAPNTVEESIISYAVVVRDDYKEKIGSTVKKFVDMIFVDEAEEQTYETADFNRNYVTDMEDMIVECKLDDSKLVDAELLIDLPAFNSLKAPNNITNEIKSGNETKLAVEFESGKYLKANFRVIDTQKLLLKYEDSADDVEMPLGEVEVAEDAVVYDARNGKLSTMTFNALRAEVENEEIYVIPYTNKPVDGGFVEANILFVVGPKTIVPTPTPSAKSVIEFTWDTTGQLDKSFTIEYDGAIDILWGDDFGEFIMKQYPSLPRKVEKAHTYKAEGEYKVKITGDKITYFNCASEKIISLDVSKASELINLDCQNNLMTELDISQNKKLGILDCTQETMKELKMVVSQIVVPVKHKNTKIVYIDEDILEIIEKLDELGVMQFDYDGGFRDQNTMTRAEMVVILCKMVGIDEAVCDENKSVTSRFSDVPVNDWYTGYINAADDKGLLVNVSADDKFRPNDTITLNEVLTFCVNALGRGEYVSAMGVWPANYIAEATKLGLVDGVKTSKANKGNIAITVWNTLKAPYVWDVIGNNYDGTVALGNSGKSLLSIYFKDYYEKNVTYNPSSIIESIYITYDANTTDEVQFMPKGGKKAYGAATTIGMPIDPVREGYSFAGWNTAVDGTGKTYLNNSLYTGNTSLTLYAQWVPNTVEEANWVFGIVTDVRDVDDDGEEDGIYCIPARILLADGTMSREYEFIYNKGKEFADEFTWEKDVNSLKNKLIVFKADSNKSIKYSDYDRVTTNTLADNSGNFTEKEYIAVAVTAGNYIDEDRIRIEADDGILYIFGEDSVIFNTGDGEKPSVSQKFDLLVRDDKIKVDGTIVYEKDTHTIKYLLINEKRENIADFDVLYTIVVRDDYKEKMGSTVKKFVDLIFADETEEQAYETADFNKNYVVDMENMIVECKLDDSKLVDAALLIDAPTFKNLKDQNNITNEIKSGNETKLAVAFEAGKYLKANFRVIDTQKLLLKYEDDQDEVETSFGEVEIDEDTVVYDTRSGVLVETTFDVLRKAIENDELFVIPYTNKPQDGGIVSANILFIVGPKSSTPILTPTEEPQYNFASYKDIKAGDWYYDSEVVKFVTEKGYINGLSEKEFGPDLPMTRGQFISMLYNMSGKPEVAGTNSFKDVKSVHNVDAIVWGNKVGLMSGYPDGTFRPDSSIDREQVVTVLKKYAEFIGINTNARANLTTFNDYADVYDWAYDAVSWAIAKGIMKGDNYNRILPHKSATRAEVSAILKNFEAVK